MKKDVTGNAGRQQRFRQNRRKKGKKRMEIWVTDGQEREIRMVLKETEALEIFGPVFQKIP